ncbi:MAG: NUDIX domain-containing protein [Candidatus Moraniibacteriota bacterium]
MEKFWAGGFLYNPKNNSVLLHKRDSTTKFNPNYWAFFGGLNEGAETPVDCFVREINEEIGIKFKIEDVITLYDYFNEEFQTHRFVFYALSEKTKSEFVLNEGENFDWINLNRIDKYNLTEKTEKDLKSFIKKIKYLNE